jgi:ABC-type sulfate transport system permease component
VAALQDPAAVAAARNAALAAFTALALGLAGGVVGGWMGSDEPMTFTVRRKADGNGYARGDRR